MLDAVRGLRLNPLLIGLGLMLACVVATYGDRHQTEEDDGGTMYVDLRPPTFSVPPGVQLVGDLEYSRPNGVPLRLDLYRPEEIAAPLPVLVWIHGDGWRTGGKDEPRPAMHLVHHGYAVASIEYRLSDAALFPAQIEDCQAAIRWLRSHAEEYHLDPDRFAAWGEGAGGHLAALLGTMSRRTTSSGDVSASVQAVIDFGGPIDFLRLDEQTTDPEAVRHNDAWSPESLLVGGALPERKEVVALTNPLAYLSDHDRPPPFMILHSHNDPTIPLRQSEILAQALRRHGSPVLFLRPQARVPQGALTQQLEDIVAEFLERRLKKPKTVAERAERRHQPKRLLREHAELSPMRPLGLRRPFMAGPLAMVGLRPGPFGKPLGARLPNGNRLRSPAGERLAPPASDSPPSG